MSNFRSVIHSFFFFVYHFSWLIYFSSRNLLFDFIANRMAVSFDNGANKSCARHDWVQCECCKSTPSLDSCFFSSSAASYSIF